MTAPDLAADTLAVLDGFAGMVRRTGRYPGKDELGDERTAECLAYARSCVLRARLLTASDPEPPSGTVVRDSAGGGTWEHYEDGGYWVRTDIDDCDPESWAKIAGNYGPVTVLEWGVD